MKTLYEIQKAASKSGVLLIHILDMIGGIYFNDDQSLDNISTSSLLAQCFILTVIQPPISLPFFLCDGCKFLKRLFLYKTDKLIMYNKCLFCHISDVFLIVLEFVFRLRAHSSSHWHKFVFCLKTLCLVGLNVGSDITSVQNLS